MIFFFSCSETTINIPISVYKQLLDDCVNFQKCKVTIEKLKNILQKKAVEIKKLQKCKNVCIFSLLLSAYHVGSTNNNNALKKICLLRRWISQQKYWTVWRMEDQNKNIRRESDNFPLHSLITLPTLTDM